MAESAREAVKCPAGEGIELTGGGPGCRCKILRETITLQENSRTLQLYCSGDPLVEGQGYTACNVWRAQVDADRANRGKDLQRDIERSVPKADRDTRVVVG